MFGRLLPVIIGFAVWTAIWLVGNTAVTAAMPGQFGADGTTEYPGILALILALSLIASVTAGYITGRLSKRKPMKQVWILAGLQLVIGILVQIQYLNVMPMWYHGTFLTLLIPGILAGGKFSLNKATTTSLA